ncbi:MAG TPA: DUF1501 domain-containing protein [Candidatus Xenobia bacterium]|nr:DUF1501 domain-containing protein [Candidatus Xenobia bacterium]
MRFTRRFFLKSSGIALVGLSPVPSFLARAAAASSGRGKILIVIFQRGAADGLNIVIPHGEKDYYSLRPTIAIPRPKKGDEQAAIDLDGHFGLHPVLQPFKQLYDEKLLAVVHAAGSPDSTRSHFDAQDFMESGTPGLKSTQDGWLNRYLQSAPIEKPSAFRGVSLTSQLPRILQGRAPALAVPNVSRFGIEAGRYTDTIEDGLASLYAASGDNLLAPTAKETFEAVERLRRVNPAQYRPAAGVEYPQGPFGQTMLQVAQLIQSNLGIEIVFAEVGGWDHHVNEGGSQGQLANLLRQFGGGIAALTRDLGDRMQDVVIVTLSEFGRTVAENGNRGTDHGHANAIFVVGGPVAGGKVYGQWPGLDRDQLFEGRDLALTTDFRDVLAEVIVHHLGATDLKSVFPRYDARPDKFRRFLRG